MRLHKVSGFLLIYGLVNQASCADKISKLAKKNAKTIKTLTKENKLLRERLAVLETFVNDYQMSFITRIDGKVDQLLSFWDLDHRGIWCQKAGETT